MPKVQKKIKYTKAEFATKLGLKGEVESVNRDVTYNKSTGCNDTKKDADFEITAWIEE